MRLNRLVRLAAPAALLGLSACGMPLDNIAAENRAYHWSGNVTACDDPGVLADITTRFAYAETRFGADGTMIEQITQVRERSFRRNGPAYIPRRDCVATARLSNQRSTPVYYTILAGLGTLSLGDKVEFCVAGHDHYHLGEAACTRMSR